MSLPYHDGVTRTLQRYLEECASFCPLCRATDQLFRYTARATIGSHRDDAPRISVPCGCGRCQGEWIEDYALQGVTLKR
jgi:hypothetical protein